jgi:hypothetical protein
LEDQPTSPPEVQQLDPLSQPQPAPQAVEQPSLELKTGDSVAALFSFEAEERWQISHAKAEKLVVLDGDTSIHAGHVKVQRGNGQIGFIALAALRRLAAEAPAPPQATPAAASHSAARPAGPCPYNRVLVNTKPANLLELTLTQGDWVKVTGPGMSSEFVWAESAVGKRGQVRKGMLKACPAADGISPHACPPPPS